MTHHTLGGPNTVERGSSSATSRRAFVAALATAAVAPQLLGATPAPPGRDAAIDAILNRRISEQTMHRSRCDCAECATARAKPFLCTICGFEGEPSVYACECADERQKTITYWESVLAGNQRSDLSRREVKRALRELRGEAKEVRVCSAAEGRCCHTLRYCPVCARCEDGTADDGGFSLIGGPSHAAAIIRDLRVALRARGVV